MRLILVRHGQTEVNRLGRIQGIGPAPLNELGLSQAAAVARAVQHHKPFVLYASPLKRAVQTAQAIAGHTDAPVLLDEGLVELNVGEFEGLTGRQLREQFTDVMRRWDENAADTVMPGGESLSAVRDRAWRTVRTLAVRHGSETVISVTHNFTIQMIICTALDMPLNSFRKLRIDLGSMSRLDVTGDRTVQVSINETWHLKDLVRT